MGAIPATLVSIATLAPGVAFVFFFLRKKSSSLRISLAVFLGWLLSLFGSFIALWIVFEAGIWSQGATALIVTAAPKAFIEALISPIIGIYIAKKYRAKAQLNQS